MPLQIKGFLETSLSDWDGYLCSVVFVGGCNWRCFYCHNHPLVYEPDKMETIAEDVVLTSLKKQKGWIDGLCVSGGEPTLQPDLIPFLEKVKELGVKIKLDTNASSPRVIEELISKKLVDYLAIDIKTILYDKDYIEICRAKVCTRKIKESITLIDKAYQEKKLDYELRTTLAPPHFSGEVVEKIARQFEFAPHFILQQFNPNNVRNEAAQQSKLYSKEEINRWAEKARKYISKVSIRGL